MAREGCRVRLVLVSALTPLHPGAGRAPGLVDLPSVRDNMGIPLLRGSMIKGALKTYLGRLNDCLAKPQKSQGYVIDCGKNRDCKRVCALLGGEVGDGPKGISALSIGDLYPLAVPVPLIALDGGPGESIRSLGVGYVTTASAASYIASIAEEAGLGDLASLLSKLASNVVESSQKGFNGVSTGFQGTLLAGITPIKVDKVSGQGSSINGLAGSLNPLYRAYQVEERLIVLEDTLGSRLLDGLMDRRTRVRLDRETKTVSKRALWTEEYLPWGSLLAGPLADTGFRSDFAREVGLDGSKCAIDELVELLRSKAFSLVIGGKESVGGGLARASINP